MESKDLISTTQGPVSCGYCRTAIWVVVVKGRPYFWDSFDAGDALGTTKIVSIMTKGGLKSAMFYCASPKCKSTMKMNVNEEGFLDLD